MYFEKLCERHPPVSEVKVLSWNEAQVPSVGRPTVASMLLTTSAPVMRDTRSSTEGLTFSARLMPSRSKLSCASRDTLRCTSTKSGAIAAILATVRPRYSCSWSRSKLFCLQTLITTNLLIILKLWFWGRRVQDLLWRGQLCDTLID